MTGISTAKNALLVPNVGTLCKYYCQCNLKFSIWKVFLKILTILLLKTKIHDKN